MLNRRDNKGFDRRDEIVLGALTLLIPLASLALLSL